MKPQIERKTDYTTIGRASSAEGKNFRTRIQQTTPVNTRLRLRQDSQAIACKVRSNCPNSSLHHKVCGRLQMIRITPAAVPPATGSSATAAGSILATQKTWTSSKRSTPACAPASLGSPPAPSPGSSKFLRTCAPPGPRRRRTARTRPTQAPPMSNPHPSPPTPQPTAAPPPPPSALAPLRCGQPYLQLRRRCCCCRRRSCRPPT